MAGELIVKNGLRVSGSTIISGSISATSFTGSFSGSVTNAVSASYAATASVLLGSVTSASYASTSSFPWFQTGSNIAYAGGNVGIGTTSPTTPLYISSSTNTGLLIKTPNPTLQLTDASDTWYIQGVSGDRLRVTRGGTADLFTIKTNGDVGIGVGATTPTARLQVRGAGTTSATTALRIEDANTSASFVVRADSRVGINTATPGATLEVNGNMIISGSIDLRNSNGIRLYDSSGFGGGRILGSYSYLPGEVFIQPLASLTQNFVFSPNNGMSIGGFTIGGTAGSPPSYGLAVSGSVGIGTRVPITQLDVSGSGRFTSNLTVTGSIVAASFTGSLSGSALNAVSASFATTASYWSGSILNATSASFAATASGVNTLNQNVLITGSLTVGATSIGSGENTIAVGPPPNGGVGEGGQILLAAAGGAYTSASMLDTYQDSFRVLRGTNAGSDAFKLRVDLDSGQVQIPNYNSPTAFTGAPINSLATDTAGNILTVQGYTGIVTINTMPPVNFDIQNGIIVNVF